MLPNLERFIIQVNLQGYLNLNPSSFGPHWGHFSLALNQSTCPALKSFSIGIEVGAINTHFDLEAQEREAEIFATGAEKALEIYHCFLLQDLERHGRSVVCMHQARASVAPEIHAEVVFSR